MKKINIQNHHILSSILIFICVLFLVFLFLVYSEYIDGYQYAFDYISYPFLVLVLIATIIMSYHRARQRHGDDYLAPLLSSLILVLQTHFFIFLMTPWLTINNPLSLMDVLKFTFIYTFPSFISFGIMRRLVHFFGDQSNEFLLDWHFYVSWIEMLTNIMTIITFLELFFQAESTQSLIGIRGTIWAFYSVMADYLLSFVKRRKTSGK